METIMTLLSEVLAAISDAISTVTVLPEEIMAPFQSLLNDSFAQIAPVWNDVWAAISGALNTLFL